MTGERILIVDDDIDLLSLLDWNLNRLGYKTSVAIDGLEAMKRIGEFKPDLLLLDLMLPEVDGLKLCRWIKTKSEAGALSPFHVIILSALSNPIDRTLALSAGADDYITKPFDIMDLVLKIKRVLEYYPLPPEERRFLISSFTLFSISSLTFLKAPVSFPRGSSMGQSILLP